MFAEYRLSPVQVSCHVYILGALPREHKDDLAPRWSSYSREHTFRVLCLYGADSVSNVFANKHSTVDESATANLVGIGDIRQILFRMLLQVLSQIGCRSLERISSSRRDH